MLFLLRRVSVWRAGCALVGCDGWIEPELPIGDNADLEEFFGNCHKHNKRHSIIENTSVGTHTKTQKIAKIDTASRQSTAPAHCPPHQPHLDVHRMTISNHQCIPVIDGRCYATVFATDDSDRIIMVACYFLRLHSHNPAVARNTFLLQKSTYLRYFYWI